MSFSSEEIVGLRGPGLFFYFSFLSQRVRAQISKDGLNSRLLGMAVKHFAKRQILG